MAAKREQWRVVVYLDGLHEQVNGLPGPPGPTFFVGGDLGAHGPSHRWSC
jgi:hypothetical protein